MLPRLLSSCRQTVPVAWRQLSVTSACSAKRITEKTVGDTTVVELEEVAADKRPKIEAQAHSCPLCSKGLPTKVKYTDVLILEQFMREDGTVLPKQLTGLCNKQQLRVERCVMQAHWAGLFPDKTLPDFDRAGYKRFNRYWSDDMEMYQSSMKVKPGVWFYVSRYNPRGALFKEKKGSVDANA